MFVSKLTRAIPRTLNSSPTTTHFCKTLLPTIRQPLFTRTYTTAKTMASFKTPSSDPPKNEMQYFPDMTTALPSTSGEFRRVLWTGLYSQLVLMTVPVGGDIGEEVSHFLWTTARYTL